MLEDCLQTSDFEIATDFLAAKLNADLYAKSKPDAQTDQTFASLLVRLGTAAIALLETGIGTETGLGERAVRELGWAGVMLEGPIMWEPAKLFVDTALDRFGNHMPEDLRRELSRSSLMSGGVYREGRGRNGSF
jgi:hypothetical protein